MKFPGYSQQATNQIQGKFFEEALDRHAKMRGFFIEKNHLRAKFISKTKTQIFKSDLDFKIITKQGVTGFFDCKSYDGDKFTFSEMTAWQLNKSAQYAEWNVPSGFIVWFRGPNKVCFFSAAAIVKAGKGSSFTPEKGFPLGSIEGIEVGKLFMLRPEPTDQQLQVGKESSPAQYRLY